MSDNPHMSPLGRVILERWEEMVARYKDEARDGLSVKQVGKALGPRYFDGRALLVGPAVRPAGYRCVAMTLAWLARRCYLERTMRGRYFLGTLAASNSGMFDPKQNVVQIKEALDSHKFNLARELAAEAGRNGQALVVERTAAAIARMAPERTIRFGYFTVVLAEGGRYTFRVKEQDADAKFAAGKVIVSYLFGPNNEADYKGCAFVNDSRISVWNRYRNNKPLCDALAILAHDPKAAALGYAKESGKCYICSRLLTEPLSIELGVGPICREKGY